MTRMILLSVIFLMAATAADAGLKGKARNKKQEAQLMSSMEKATKKCPGVSLETKIDWKSFAPAGAEFTKKMSVGSYCDISFAMGSVCKKYKADAINALKKYKKFVCKFKEVDAKKCQKNWSMAMKGDTITFTFGKKSCNKNPWVTAFLENNLE